MGEKQIIDLNMEPANMLREIYAWLQEQGRTSGKLWPELQKELKDKLDSIFTNWGTAGDYSRPEVQALYLLRYLNCYAYGYMDMYRTFLKTYEAELGGLNNLFVTSIGCGNQVDLWGLCDAVRQVNGPIRLPVSYVGVDINPWAEEFLFLPEAFVRCSIGDYLNMTHPKHIAAADAYLFAKCVSEFTSAELGRIYTGLPKLLNRHPEQRKVWILFYLRTDKDNGKPYDGDMDICRSICGSVKGAGYIMKRGHQPPEPWGGESYIHQLDTRFRYPQDIKNDLNNNKSYPMSMVKHIYYWITYFER